VYRRDLFAGRVALITGGGTGIGLRIAREFVYLGGTVMLASRKKPVLENAARVIEADIARDQKSVAAPTTLNTAIATATAASSSSNVGGRVFITELNIRDPKSVSACIDTTIARCGRLDILVNNAGGQFPSPAENLTDKGWLAVIDTNLNGTFYMMREAYNKVFSVQNSGNIINILADMERGFPIMAHTGAARAAGSSYDRATAPNECGIS
jgi:NAD(P)-dependent dehydrogenase (short-subunit alcohol dehydrogenase family)